MRYHFTKPKRYWSNYGETYICDHPIYNRCTLYKIKDRGLAVIQQRFDPITKKTWWTEIDPWMTDLIYLNSGFKRYFDVHSKTSVDELYPTVTIRQIMWALRMKPIPKEVWETAFDKKNVYISQNSQLL